MDKTESEQPELVEFDPASQKRRRRRRKRSSKSASLNSSVSLMSASEILARAAKDGYIESSPSSLAQKGGRKLSALDLTEDEPHFTSTTGTPGSLDSSRSLWELGTVEADEDEILSATRPVIMSRRMQSLEQDVDQITSSIDQILRSLPDKITGSDLGRMCLPASCGKSMENAPQVDLSGISNFFDRIRVSVSESIEALTANLLDSKLAQPEGVETVMEALQEGVIPSATVPALNRRQRRTLQHVSR